MRKAEKLLKDERDNLKREEEKNTDTKSVLSESHSLDLIDLSENVGDVGGSQPIDLISIPLPAQSSKQVNLTTFWINESNGGQADSVTSIVEVAYFLKIYLKKKL